MLLSLVFYFFHMIPVGVSWGKKKINKKVHFISKGLAFYLTLKNSSIFWHSAGTYVQIWRFQEKKFSKSQNLTTLGQFFPQKIPFCSTGFLFCHLDAKVHLEDQLKQGAMSHCGLAIYIKKYLKAKEELWKLKYFTMQKYNLQKKSSKRNQNPSRYYNSVSNLKFQHKPKYHLSKIFI